MNMTRIASVAFALLAATAGCRQENALERPAAREHTGAKLNLPELPVLSPTALTADAGDGRAYLRWNLQLEDERVVGWRVVRIGDEKQIMDEVLTEAATVIAGLDNGKEYVFAVVGVLADGSLTPHSNTANVIPRATGDAKVETKTGAKLKVGKREITLHAFDPSTHNNTPSVQITFPDGQVLVYDRFRPVHWQARDGEHLIYPEHFGNGLDIGQFDKRGLAEVIPPGGSTTQTLDIDGRRFRFEQPMTREYCQQGSPHPHITDPTTLPLERRWQDQAPRWMSATMDGDRVTVHYWLPMVMMGYNAWHRVLVWETWWPIERELHGTSYHGLARMVEVQMPSAWKTGYQVMLNDGFGPGGGSREGVVSYSTGFRNPGREIVDFSGPANRAVTFQTASRLPRKGSMYHPNQNSLQASPLIFYDWDRPGASGSMLITARSLYYHCANASATYAEQGVDGIWPGLAWDLARSGVRTHVDTVEYLYASAPEQPLPQRFVNARFWAYGNVSRRMGVQDRIAVVSNQWPSWVPNVKQRGGPRAYAEHYVKECRNWGVDAVCTPWDFWISLPFVADDRWRTDPAYRDNAGAAEMCRILKEGGFKAGYWLRPELMTVSIGSALSETIPSASDYGGFFMCNYPEAVDMLTQRGIPEFRENPDWARRQIDGSWPVNTPYQWVPMSLASGWHDRIIWPALKTTAAMGFSCVMVDGGFGGMEGVDYSPMLAGRADAALPMQPFWWRFWRTMEHVGIRPFGECTMGWRGGNVTVGGAGDEHYAWMFQMGWHRQKPATPRFLHQLHQLYNGTEFSSGGPEQVPLAVGDELLPVRRFAVEFNRKHPKPPDRVELVGLRQLEETEITVKRREAPATSLVDKSAEEPEVKVKVRPWTWGDAVWHYNGGTSIVYPAHDEINWADYEQ